MTPLSHSLLALVTVAVAQGQTPSSPPEVPKKTLRSEFDEGRERVAERLFGLSPSAFGDVLLAPNDQGRKRWHWGAFELDLAGPLHENLDLSLAVVTSPAATQLTVGFLDYHPFGGTIAPRGRLWVEKGFHIQVGRFDVPFGGDWQFFASKDSVSISRPLTTDGIMEGGYNDVGARLLGNNGTVNFTAFLLRGFGDGRLAGGRIGLTPFGNPFSLKETREPKAAEAGLSFLYDTDRDHRKRESAWAVDAEARLGDWSLRTEYISRRREPGLLAEGATRHGWHLTQELAFPEAWVPTTVFLRYDRFKELPASDLPGELQDTRFSTGASLGILGFFLLKVEWQHALESTGPAREAPGFDRNLWLAQLVLVL